MSFGYKNFHVQVLKVNDKIIQEVNMSEDEKNCFKK